MASSLLAEESQPRPGRKRTAFASTTGGNATTVSPASQGSNLIVLFVYELDPGYRDVSWFILWGNGRCAVKTSCRDRRFSEHAAFGIVIAISGFAHVQIDHLSMTTKEFLNVGLERFARLDLDLDQDAPCHNPIIRCPQWVWSA